jgi:hypothetical protein
MNNLKTEEDPTPDKCINASRARNEISGPEMPATSALHNPDD